MAQKKADGVIEAVRYNERGLLSLIRVYERRGPTYSDRVLFTRDQLMKALRTGKKFYVGKRIESLASTFELSNAVHLSGNTDHECIISISGQPGRDDLPDAPLF